MTLADFLLARTADTIADCREVQALAVSRGIQPDDPREPSLRVARTLLAECEAVRRIVEVHSHHEERYHDGSGGMACGRCHHDRDYGFIPEGWCETLTLLALPFAAHPDYRDEWKP